MPVVNNDTIPQFRLPGLDHQTLAGPEHGMKTIEILRVSVRITIEGVDTDFGPNSTLQIPSDVVHQIVNTGTEEMFLIAALGQASVKVRTADNQPIPLPWQAS